MTDPAPKKKRASRAKKTTPKLDQPKTEIVQDTAPISAKDAPTQQKQGDHGGFQENARVTWQNPQAEIYENVEGASLYQPFPDEPNNGEQHTPIDGGWTYTYDGNAKAWFCYERGFRGPEGPAGPEGPRGPAGDVAAVVEVPTPPDVATRGVFYLTANNQLLIGI